MESTSFTTFPLGSSTTKLCSTVPLFTTLKVTSPAAALTSLGAPLPSGCDRPPFSARAGRPDCPPQSRSGRVLAGGLLRFGQKADRSLRPLFDAGEVDHRDLIVQGDLAPV